MSPLAKVQSILAKPFMSGLFFASGVTYDSLTLTRIDRLQDNLILLLYLVALGFLIVLTGRLGMAAVETSAIEPQGSSFSRFLIKARPYYPMAMQFLLGGLFSAYAVFYSRSATLTRTGVFLGVLVLLLMANEFLRDRLSNLRLLVALYALASFSFFTFFLPVMVGTIGTWVFLLGAATKRGSNAACGAADLSAKSRTVAEGSGIGRRAGDRPYWHPDRILFSELDSSCAALDEIRLKFLPFSSHGIEPNPL